MLKNADNVDVRCIWSICVFNQTWCAFGQLHKPKPNTDSKTSPNPSPNLNCNPNPIASALRD